MPPLSSPGGVATLGEIGDVDLTGLEDGDGIEFDSASSTWKAGLPDGEFYVLGGNAASGPASSYSSSDLQDNPEAVSGSTRSDIWWSPSGLRAYTIRGPSPRMDQYDVFPAFSITPGDWTGVNLGVIPPSVGTTGFGMQLSPDGTRLSLTNTGSSGFIRTFPIATPFDFSTVGSLDSSHFFGSGVTRHRWKEDGLSVYVQQSQIIRERICVTPFDLTGSSAGNTFDVAPDAVTINGWCLSADGLFLYASRNSDKRLVSWQMTTPFDLSTAGSFDGTGGPLLNAGSNFFVPEGFNFRPANGDILMGDSLQSGGAAQRMQVVSL